MRKVSIYAHAANPRVDYPLQHEKRARAKSMVIAGSIEMISEWVAQFVENRREVATAAQLKTLASDVGYDIAAGPKGQDLVWVPSGESWQMKHTFGSMARHFGQTRNGMNFAPNKSSNPSDHRSSLPCMASA